MGALEVQLVGNEFGLNSLVVPVLTLLGGLLGVLLGAWFSRRTLHSIAEREDTRELHRARRDWTAERRRAVGAANVLHQRLTERALLLEDVLQEGRWPAKPAVALDLSAADLQLVASWVPTSTWQKLAEAMTYLWRIEHDASVEAATYNTPVGHLFPAAAFPEDQVRDTISAVTDALEALNPDELTDAEHVDVLLPEYLTALPQPPQRLRWPVWRR